MGYVQPGKDIFCTLYYIGEFSSKKRLTKSRKSGKFLHKNKKRQKRYLF
ncbi:hypothetical protein CLOHYLEM_07509 [[Clostridium] hylemonae DSM 15053]|uniref:Uncharacterized protein n=1 Tax=[Clostridium] hylemonae DSM 15053 TaxID=553973 RepID=C0C5X2_9FIRM|nr:hypothetical protein CLOHYLEM_07509 [[Clostridium] hylemonae DSM 15053]